MNTGTLTIYVAIESPHDLDLVRKRCVLAVEAEVSTCASDELLDGNVSVRWNMHLTEPVREP